MRGPFILDTALGVKLLETLTVAAGDARKLHLVMPR